MTRTIPRHPGRLALLDSLRFLAALSVVAFHYTSRVGPAWNGDPAVYLGGVSAWTTYGRLGVPLFFIISGFVILMAAWDRDAASFVASRVGRLFPAYWVAVAVSALITLVLWPEVSAWFGHTVTKTGAALNLTMVQSAFGVPDLDGPYWTLWYEVRFYVLIALFMLVGITRRRVLAFASLWPVVGAVAGATGAGTLASWLMPDYAAFFAGGMLLYVLYREGHDAGVWLLLGAQILVAVHSTVTSYSVVLSQETSAAPSKTVIGILTVAGFGLVAAATLTRLRELSSTWLVYLGALTYPVYLLHENLGWLVINRSVASVGPWAAVVGATAVVLVASALVHHLVEKPLGPRLRRTLVTTLAKDTIHVGTKDADSDPPPRQSPPAAPTTPPTPGRTAATGQVSHGHHRQLERQPGGTRDEHRRAGGLLETMTASSQAPSSPHGASTAART